MSRLGQGRAAGKLAHGELGRQHAYAQPTRLLDATAVLRELLAWGAFRERFVAHTRAWKCGDPRDPETKMGPVISEAHHADVSRYIEIAKSEGGEILPFAPPLLSPSP